MARPSLSSIPRRARLPVALLTIATLFALFALLDTGSPDTGPDPAELGGPTQRQLERAAARLEVPGLYVAPQVPLSRLDGDAFDTLRDEARKHEAPLRIAVLPGSAAREATVETLATNLHDLVGEDGIYLVLVDRAGKADVAGFQWTEDRPYYAVEQAVTAAESCCAQDYPKLIGQMIEDSADTKPRPWMTALVVLITGALAVAAALAGYGWWRRQRQERMDSDALALLRPELGDELASIEQRLQGFPAGAAKGNDRLGHRHQHARVIVQEARTRFEEMRTLGEADAVVALIADFRFQVVAIEALRQGRAAPERQPPCLIDPRHGPSSELRAYAPDDLAVDSKAVVLVCHQCADVLDRGQRPMPRRLPTAHGGWAPYWAAGRIGEVYVNGYRVAVPFLGNPPLGDPEGVGTNGRPTSPTGMTD